MITVAKSRAEWLEQRKKGIGASEAGIILGLSPYKTNVDLWREKVGLIEAEDISDKPQVKYGNDAEPLLRALFTIDNPQFTVSYTEFKIFWSDKHPFLFATLDGELFDDDRNGVLEIKTTEIKNSNQWAAWDGRIPDHYYAQVCHQLIATGYDFSVLKAQIKHKGGITTRQYHFEADNLIDDMAYLLEAEKRFWQYVEQKKEPPRALPQI